MTDTGSNVGVLTRDECLRLLASQPVGRFAVASPGEPPLVVPVNYVLDDDVIVFRSDPGSKVRLLRQAPVSFQVDAFDWAHRTGWSVLARGVAYEATPDEVNHLLLEPWAAGDKRHWVRIVIADVAGRRLDPLESDWRNGARGYL